MARWHYAPTAIAKETLLREQVDASSVLLTGNTGIDALLWTIHRTLEPQNTVLQRIWGERLVLVTMHRRENLGERMHEIADALRNLASRFPSIQFVLPVHRNPAVVEIVSSKLKGISNFHLTDPLEYPDLVWAMKHAELILSDSGGIQEEAPSLKKPVLVLRHQTERPEAVAYGTSILVGSDRDTILSTASSILNGQRHLALAPGENPYGDGHASEKIREQILQLAA